MSDKKVFVFGEVLFDCFPTGEKVLGGAPFNVAWHLQALGDNPAFISAVGNDELGQKILLAMDEWGMDTALMQRDLKDPTGQVEIKFIDDEPHYTITPDCAYDFIDAKKLKPLNADAILYHGTLGLRNAVSRAAFNKLIENSCSSIFLDVNLRSPWWQKEEVFDWMKQARWVKLNQHELHLLGFAESNIKQSMANLQQQFQIEQLIVTQGEHGALLRTSQGEFHHIEPEPVKNLVDTVGAGDAFTAVFIHGLLCSWSIPKTLNAAQKFASKIIGVRGATPAVTDFYHDVLK